jgi:hypothetical protein
MSVDGTPISRTDLARIQAEEQLHSAQQRKAVRVVASTARDVDDARMLLSILGFDAATVSAARTELTPSPKPVPKGARRGRAA